MTTFNVQPTNPLALVATLEVNPLAAPKGHLSAATQLARGLRPLAAAGASCYVPLAFLAAQATESGLKAFLSVTLSRGQLMGKDKRHNIRKLWNDAHHAGLAIAPFPPESILNLARLHEWPYPLRYAQDVVVLIIATDPLALCDDVDSLLLTVTQSLA